MVRGKERNLPRLCGNPEIVLLCAISSLQLLLPRSCEREPNIQRSVAAYRRHGAKGEAKLKEMDAYLAQGKEKLNLFLGLEKRALKLGWRGEAETATPSANSGFTVPELTRLYDFPAEFDGHGQCIGLIELGGGYKQSDLKTYFGGLGLRVPKVTAVSVDGVKNSPTGDSAGPDGMVTMNIEVAGAVAHRSLLRTKYRTRFCRRDLHSGGRQGYAPSVLIVTWGGPEMSRLDRNVPIVNSLEMSPLGNVVVIAGVRTGAKPARAKRKCGFQRAAISPGANGRASFLGSAGATDGPSWPSGSRWVGLPALAQRDSDRREGKRWLCSEQCASISTRSLRKFCRLKKCLKKRATGRRRSYRRT
jgi:hypothetical protein